MAEAFQTDITRKGFDPPATQYLRISAAHTTSLASLKRLVFELNTHSTYIIIDDPVNCVVFADDAGDDAIASDPRPIIYATTK